MAPTGRSKDGLLAKVNFPLYSVQMLTSRHVLVAGGGGSAKTGVANGFEIYEIYHNGERFCAEEVIRHETGPSVVMNCATRNDKRRSFIVAGQENHCQMYHVNIKISENGVILKPISHEDDNDNLKLRKGDLKTSDNEQIKQEKSTKNMYIDKKVKFDIKPGDSIQTDFTGSEPIQRVVRISTDGKIMATGGTSGTVVIWNFPRLTKICELKSHTNEIDDLDFSPDNKFVISIAKDGLGIIWDLNTRKAHLKLTWTMPEGSKYLFKRCRYSVIEDNKEKFRLFSLANPLGKAGKQKGYIQQWNPEKGKLTKIVGIDESLSALAVRDDGRFIAVGSMFSGSVSIYIAFSLQRILHIPGAHMMFVTGLEFLPVQNNDGPPISSDSEAAVISISVDNRICIHSIPHRHTLPVWIAILLIIVILFLTFLVCSYMGI